MNNDFEKTYILGVRVDCISKKQALVEIKKAIDTNLCGYVVTPYSEFFLHAQKDREFRDILNDAFISAPDGVFTQWASAFLSLKTSPIRLISFIQIPFQFIYSLVSIIFNRKFIETIVKERFPGSTFIYDVCALAQENNFKVALLGGFDFGNGNTGSLAAKKLIKMYPKLQIVEVYPGDREKEEVGEVVVETLRKSHANILFCCYNPVKQEKWLAQNLKNTGINIGFAMGGTLDYVSGEKLLPPPFITKIGLEWFFRPFYAERKSVKRRLTRIKRAWGSVPKAMLLTLIEKLKISGK